MAELVRMTRSKSLVVDRVGKVKSRCGVRQYYLENEDEKAEYQPEIGAVASSLNRRDGMKGPFGNVEARIELFHSFIERKDAGEKNHDGAKKKKKHRQHSLENDERKVIYHDRHREKKLHSRKKHYQIRGYTASKVAYERQYYCQNKEKVAGYGLEYHSRDGSARAENLRVYSRGRKEYVRSYAGYQRTCRSWKTPEAVRDYFDSVASRLNIASSEDWYRISRKQIARYGGESLCQKFGSLGAALRFAYPEFDWDLDAFCYRSLSGKKLGRLRTTTIRRPETRLSWKTPETVRDYFDTIVSRLNISNYKDWYRISREQLVRYRGVSLFVIFGSLGAALQYAYPDINWDRNAFGHRGKKSGQRWLKLKIEELLPGIDIVEDYQHPDLNWVADSEKNMELDLWIPQHRIGIEYQGEQHYFNIDKLGPSSAAGAYSERDTLKNSLCESRGITLIAIPYWWDGSIESLSATLYQARPDVFPVSHGRPIPREMPVLSRGNSEEQLGAVCRAEKLGERNELKNIE